jgi:hypothetical protein
LKAGTVSVVMLTPTEAESANRQLQQIYVTLNWFEELKQRVTGK